MSVIYLVFVSEISFMDPAFSSFGLNTNIVRIVKKNLRLKIDNLLHKLSPKSW